MLYIVVALKPEAQAFVDKFKLKKSKLSGFSLFYNGELKLIVSGIGHSRARVATQTLINQFDITDDDVYLNIGICAADAKYKIGTLLEIGGVVYENTKHSFSLKKLEILCSDIAATTTLFSIVDMESFGFYDAVIHNPAIKRFHILKVVSDHFEPKKVTKEKTKMLIFNQINAINEILKK